MDRHDIPDHPKPPARPGFKSSLIMYVQEFEK